MTALTIYKTTILPLLKYSNVIFSLIALNQRKKMQRLQNKALSIIYKHPVNIGPVVLHTWAKLATLAQRADRQLVCMMYRRAHYCSHFPLEESAGVTRSSGKIRFSLPRPKFPQQFPQYYGACLWDQLDLATQKSQEYAIFQMKIPKRPDYVRYPALIHSFQ